MSGENRQGGDRKVDGQQRSRLQPHLGQDFRCSSFVGQLETHLARDMLHLAIVRQNRRGDAFEFFIAADLDEYLQKLRAQAVVLPLVAYGQGELGFVRSMQFAQASYAEDFRLAVFGVAALDYERHLAVVVNEANAAESFMHDALVEFQRSEVAE